MCDLITKFTSLCTQYGHLHDQSVVLKEDIFQYHRKKIITGGGLNTEAVGLENEDFSDEC